MGEAGEARRTELRRAREQHREGTSGTSCREPRVLESEAGLGEVQADGAELWEREGRGHGLRRGLGAGRGQGRGHGERRGPGERWSVTVGGGVGPEELGYGERQGGAAGDCTPQARRRGAGPRRLPGGGCRLGEAGLLLWAPQGPGAGLPRPGTGPGWVCPACVRQVARACRVVWVLNRLAVPAGLSTCYTILWLKGEASKTLGRLTSPSPAWLLFSPS